jgi:hypothetical protein
VHTFDESIISSAAETQGNRKMMAVYLVRTKVHCKTPAIPVHEDGVSGSNASWTSIPAEPASDTKAMTYDRNSHVLDLHIAIQIL